jgi:hypothetical protein
VTLTLLAPLQRQHKALVADLRAQSDDRPELSAWLHAQYDAAFGTRTGGTYETWRDEQVDQAAVAWVLGTVFVRFCEDNDLIDQPWIAGPGDRTDAAVQAQTAWLLEQTELRHARHWLREAFGHLAALPATAALFDAHNPVWRWDMTADGAAALLDFWRRGAGVHDFTDPDLDTRFLGDLYQDLSVEARKRYALLQTPEFVEEFILDLTLEESLREYGLEDTSLIDPTCGSGHFLLGAFGRLVKRWEREHPAMYVRERVQKALDQVTGVDVNPFAVAIARFRLLVAALQACDEKRLADAPGFSMRLAAGDSLLRWGQEDSSHQGDILAYLETSEAYAYYTEDAEALADYLRPGQYSVAVGNPPYITVNDLILKKKYRQLYRSCSGLYSLSVPFVERLFELARVKDEGARAGIVGQITSNSFMTRQFGKKLIERFLAERATLSYVIDTSGAYIPNHGTSTVILIGRRKARGRTPVRLVQRIAGEPGTPGDPSKGQVWSEIVRHLASPGWIGSYISVVDQDNEIFARYPWVLSAADSANLVLTLAEGRDRIRDRTLRAGFFGMTHADELFLLPVGAVGRRRLAPSFRPAVTGEGVRDWLLSDNQAVFFPYDNQHLLVSEQSIPAEALRWYWPYRVELWSRTRFGGRTYREDNVPWYSWHQLPRDEKASALSVVWGEISTHVHAALGRAHVALNQTAPILKLSGSSGEDDHLNIVGLLNSSTACFWLRQVSPPKGGSGIGRGIQDEDWEDRRQFNSSRLKQLPLSRNGPLERTRRLDRLARDLAVFLPATIDIEETPVREKLQAARDAYGRLLAEMIATQEELDWEVYGLYGLLDDDLTAPGGALPPLKLGERAFEIVLARKMAAGEATTEWFARHGSAPITEIPAHWPEAYRDLVAPGSRHSELSCRYTRYGDLVVDRPVSMG